MLPRLQENQMLELVNGEGKVLARMVKPSPLDGQEQCDPGRHCAHHVGPPRFPCCLCGAVFEYARK
jgi:hypothetical protein